MLSPPLGLKWLYFTFDTEVTAAQQSDQKAETCAKCNLSHLISLNHFCMWHKAGMCKQFLINCYRVCTYTDKFSYLWIIDCHYGHEEAPIWEFHGDRDFGWKAVWHLNTQNVWSYWLKASTTGRNGPCVPALLILAFVLSWHKSQWRSIRRAMWHYALTAGLHRRQTFPVHEQLANLQVALHSKGMWSCITVCEWFAAVQRNDTVSHPHSCKNFKTHKFKRTEKSILHQPHQGFHPLMLWHCTANVTHYNAPGYLQLKANCHTILEEHAGPPAKMKPPHLHTLPRHLANLITICSLNICIMQALTLWYSINSCDQKARQLFQHRHYLTYTATFCKVWHKSELSIHMVNLICTEQTTSHCTHTLQMIKPPHS